jgi:hypothetical protein
MTKFSAKVMATAAALMLASGVAFAQTTPAPSASPSATMAPAPATAPAAKKKGVTPKAERTPESLACSAEADQKGLKGKERKSFRSKCMSAAKKAKAAPAATPAPAKKS